MHSKARDKRVLEVNLRGVYVQDVAVLPLGVVDDVAHHEAHFWHEDFPLEALLPPSGRVGVR
jgi:hypothetical protein